MTNIQHHLDDATVLSFAGGTLPRHLRIVASAHLEACDVCRENVRGAAELGAAIAFSEAPRPVNANLKQAVMGRVDTATLHRFPASRARQPSELPRALASEIGVETFDQLKWRKAGPGIEMVKLPRAAGEDGFFGLLRVKQGSQLPEHGHGGTELTLVLKGAYQDEMGEFKAGDIADLDDSISHNPVVKGDEACICLVANDAPTRFRSLAARLLQPFIGI
ncbi:ChrR family anti-sigma-E factor [Aestuariivirga litoralis]|uniref:ChrR family anti-sigma-E factor n=1 Tax=Aestuariivirga litoralis TaxID=2650924 RepID=UPI0018C681A3